MRKHIMTLALAVLLLSSCADVPEDVKQREAERQNQQSAAAADGDGERSGDLDYIPTSELGADVEKALAGQYRNMIISDKIRFELPEDYVKLSFTQASDYDSNAEELARKFFTYEEFSKMTFERTVEPVVTATNDPDFDLEDQPNLITSQTYRSEEDKLHCSVWDNGFCCMIKPALFDTMGGDGRFVTIYHADRADDLSDSYQLGDGQVTVREAVDITQKWVDDNFAYFEPEYSFRVKTVIVKKNDMDEYQFDIRVAKAYKGIYLDELREITDDPIPKEDGIGHYYKTKYSTNYLTFIMRTKPEPEYFTNTVGTLIPQEEGRLNEIVSLSSALKYMENKFSDLNETLNICDIKLKYMLTPDYDFKAGVSYDAAGTKFTAKIVWEFVIDAPPQPGSDLNDIRKYICLNAETGEMEFQFDIYQLLQ